MWGENQLNENVKNMTVTIPTDDLSIIDNLTGEQLSAVLSLYNEKHWNFSHNHEKFENNLDDFLTLPQKEMEKLTYIYLKSCEAFVSHMYSGIANSWSFNFVPSFVIDDNNTVKNVFDEWYINMLKSLLNKTWRSECDNKWEDNRISINGIDIDNENFDELVIPQIPTQKIAINKRCINTFFTLFLRNSLETISDGNWHNGVGWTDTKNVSIEISDNCIRMTDIPIRESYSEEDKKIRAENFEEKHIFDWPMNFKNRTIRTFYEIIKILNDYGGFDYEFNCGFNDDLNFFVELKF